MKGSLPGLSYRAVYDQLCGLSCRAWLQPVTPHDLRRTAATKLLRAGVAPNLVQRQLRHASLSTTQLYDRSGEEEV